MTLLCVRGWRWLAWVVGAGVTVGSAWGQSAATAALPGNAQAVLVEMAAHAAVIFAGEVVGIARADASGFVDVTFRVDQPVRGVSKNGAYVLREWAGLWTGGPERYRVGQKYLMLLTARGSSGMSAPVGGMDGAIPLTAGVDAPILPRDGNGNGKAPADQAVDAPEAQVDLRWLAARAMRTAVGLAASGSSAKVAAVKARGIGGSAGGGVAGGDEAQPIPRPIPGRPIAEPILGSSDGGTPETWVGAVAPLAGAGTVAMPGGMYPVATRLSSILALLMSGNESAHASR